MMEGRELQRFCGEALGILQYGDQDTDISVVLVLPVQRCGFFQAQVSLGHQAHSRSVPKIRHMAPGARPRGSPPSPN